MAMAIHPYAIRRIHHVQSVSGTRFGVGRMAVAYDCLIVLIVAYFQMRKRQM